MAITTANIPCRMQYIQQMPLKFIRVFNSISKCEKKTLISSVNAYNRRISESKGALSQTATGLAIEKDRIEISREIANDNIIAAL